MILRTLLLWIVCVCDATQAQTNCDPWTDLGAALPGSQGAPLLVGAGTLGPGTPVSLTLTSALQATTAYFVMGFSQISAPFKGGTLVPDVDLLQPLLTDASGVIALSSTWPAGLPQGLQAWFQYWIVDPAGPLGFSASNAVSLTTPDDPDTTLQLTLLSDAVTGLGVPGIRVLRHDSISGALLDETVTDANGVADFGAIGSPRTSLTMVFGDASSAGLLTMENVATGCYVLNLEAGGPFTDTFDIDIFGLPGAVDQVRLDLGSQSEKGTDDPLDAVMNGGGMASLSNAPIGALQSDGKFSILVSGIDGVTGQLPTFGFAADLDPSSVGGSTVTIDASLLPTTVSYTANLNITPSLSGFRRAGVSFSSPRAAQLLAAPSGSFQVPTAAGVDCWFLEADGRSTTTDTSLELAVFRPSLPANVHFDMPDIDIVGLTRDGTTQTVSWSASGTDLGAVDYTSMAVQWLDAEGDAWGWEVVASETASSITLPGLPPDLLPSLPPLNGVTYKVNVAALDTVSGFDDFVTQLAQASGNIVELSCPTGERRGASLGKVAVIVSLSGSGSGHVVSTPPGIDTSAGLFTATFSVAEDVVLTAIPDSGFSASWASDCPDPNGSLCMIFPMTGEDLFSVTAVFQ